MQELVIEQPGELPRTVAFVGDELRFGRAADNDVVLVAEEVSRHHARLCRRDRRAVLFDLDSLNGTYVNHQRVVERVLSDKDEVWLGGKCRVLFLDDTPPEDLGPKPGSSTLHNDLERIRNEMTLAGSQLTLIGAVAGGDHAAPKASPEDLVTMSRAYRRLEALYRATRLINSEFDLTKRLAAVLDTAIEVLGAERGFVMLRDGDGDVLEASVARGMGQELQSGAPSMGIARRAAIDGEPVLMANAASDEQFGMRDSIVVQNIVSAMCVPLQVEDRSLGSIYVDASAAGTTFDEADLELFASLASQSAMAIDNVQLYERMLASERKRISLGRFLSPAIVDKIVDDDASLELGGRKRMVTTLFCDIRGFTPMTERLGASQVVELLNEHFSAMTEIIFDHHGTLDKYIGDEIMAVFGSPLSAEDDAERAVEAALDIQARNAQLNLVRATVGRPELKIGIGLDTGEVLAGYIGSPMRMEFTVVGDHVNTARRLCDIAAAGQVIVGALTYEGVKDRVEARAIGAVTLEGKKNPVQAYDVRRSNG